MNFKIYPPNIPKKDIFVVLEEEVGNRFIQL